MGRFRFALDTLSQIAFITACLVLSGYVVVRLMGGVSTPEAPGAQENVPYQAGEPVKPFQDASYSSVKTTVLLFVRSTCTFCTQSMDFYRRISEQRAALSGIQIIAAAPEPIASLEQYVRGHGVSVDHLRELPKSDYKVTATPTLVVVDRTGVVVSSWQGMLNTTQETEFLRHLEQRTVVRIPIPAVAPQPPPVLATWFR